MARFNGSFEPFSHNRRSCIESFSNSKERFFVKSQKSKAEFLAKKKTSNESFSIKSTKKNIEVEFIDETVFKWIQMRLWSLHLCLFLSVFLYLEKKITLTKNTELACFSIRHYWSESFTTTDTSCEICANQEGKISFKEDTGFHEWNYRFKWDLESYQLSVSKEIPLRDWLWSKPDS